MSSLSDGGRIGSTGLRIFISKGAGTLLVRMTEPNPITSHDWHVQPICQRSLRVVRLSGTPMDRGPDFHPAVLELGAHRPISPPPKQRWAFLREPFEVIKVQVSGQAKNPPESPGTIVDNSFALRKKSKSDQQKSLESASANSREINSRVMQWLVLSRDYLQGFQRCTACARRKTLRTSFPLPSDSRSLKVPDLGLGRPFIIHAFARGHREAPLLLLTLLE